MSTTNSIGLSFTSKSTPLAVPAAAIAWNWFYAYCVLASRNFKQVYGIDHQGSPRQDLNKYGAEAVKSGKMTQAQLDQIHRVENASANSTEGFILFTASGKLTGTSRKSSFDVLCFSSLRPYRGYTKSQVDGWMCCLQRRAYSVRFHLRFRS